MNRSSVLVDVMKLLSSRFPIYDYIPLCDGQSEERSLARTDYGIVVRGVTEPEMKEFLLVIKQLVYRPLIDLGVELPLIVPLRERRAQSKVLEAPRYGYEMPELDGALSSAAGTDATYPESPDYSEPIPDITMHFRDAAEDYDYLLAA